MMTEVTAATAPPLITTAIINGVAIAMDIEAAGAARTAVEGVMEGDSTTSTSTTTTGEAVTAAAFTTMTAEAAVMEGAMEGVAEAAATTAGEAAERTGEVNNNPHAAPHKPPVAWACGPTG